MVAAGTYQVTLNMAVTYRVCTSVSVGNACLSEQNGSGVIPINITMILTNDCTTITAPSTATSVSAALFRSTTEFGCAFWATK